MIYKIIDGKWAPAKLRQDFPNTSFPRDLAYAVLPDSYAWAHPTPAPECGPYERVETAPPVMVDGRLMQQWAVVPWTPEEIQAHLVAVIQQHLDETAQAKSYDGILSLCTYATSPSPKFAAEGQAGVEWRDACWTAGYQILSECQAGTRAIPTPEELMAELPDMVWPE